MPRLSQVGVSAAGGSSAGVPAAGGSSAGGAALGGAAPALSFAAVAAGMAARY